jgi:hypothetical protein
MLDPVSIGMSAAALLISAGTAWFTLLRTGQLKMTQPTLFYLGPDGVSAKEKERGGPKVFLRTLLYCTAKRGVVIENMYVTVCRGETRQNFNIWVYREGGQLSRGSGLFVDQNGLALDHHFLLPPDGTGFTFRPGEYLIDVYVKVVRLPNPRRLASVAARLPESVAMEADKSGSGVFFDWGPDLGQYHAHSRPVPITEDATTTLSAWRRAGLGSSQSPARPGPGEASPPAC